MQNVLNAIDIYLRGLVAEELQKINSGEAAATALTGTLRTAIEEIVDDRLASEVGAAVDDKIGEKIEAIDFKDKIDGERWFENAISSAVNNLEFRIEVR
jgi:hypothetical protein